MKGGRRSRLVCLWQSLCRPHPDSSVSCQGSAWMFDSGSHCRSLGDSVNAGEGCALTPPLMERPARLGARERVWGRPREEHRGGSSHILILDSLIFPLKTRGNALAESECAYPTVRVDRSPAQESDKLGFWSHHLQLCDCGQVT